MLYAASCNPPRRAKRQRTGSLGEGPSSPTVSTSPQQRRTAAAARPPILPKQPAGDREYVAPASPDSDSGSDGEDDYDPSRDAAPAPKRRGRKPGTMSRSARESLRKLNHSRIEKARRTKINETLAALSTLVGERDRVLLGKKAAETAAPAPAEEKGKNGKGKSEGEKEFKLDVLVKTVEYMQELVSRVRALEEAMCTQCRARDGTHNSAGDEPMQVQVPPSPKRRRQDEMESIQHDARRLRLSNHEEDDSYVGDDERGLAAAEEEQPSPMPFAAPSTRSTESPRLPPIASWLPHPYVDPSSLMSSTSPKPGPVRSPLNAQLPSPPPSGRFRPSITLANMPALTLPAPAHPLAQLKTAGPPGSASLPPAQRPPRKSVSASPTVSPTWTPEDESAASLLLQIGSKPRSSSTSSTSSAVATRLSRGVLPVMPHEDIRGISRAMEVVTPGALLGMKD